MKKFNILEKEGLKYSKDSGDTNKIHIDFLTGYNSIFGEKICHGTFVIIKILEIINFIKLIKNNDIFNINIIFLKHLRYEYPISIIKKKKNFNIYQEGQKKIYIKISIRKNFELKGFKIFDKKILLPFPNKKKFSQNILFNKIHIILNTLSKYVGTIYPGQDSIISKININFNKNFKLKNNKIKILSKKLDPRLPIISNELTYKKFIIGFQTLERPIIKKIKNIQNEILENKIKNIKYNVLIIGGSQGLGRNIFDIISNNKKINKFVTFNKNKIKKNSNNVFPIKYNVYDKISKIDKIIGNNLPIKIFYFASPKIYFDNELPLSVRKDYEFIFLNFPLLLLKRYKQKISFFYPSTSNILENKNSYYSKIKLKAELKIRKLCLKNKIPLKIVRFPAINSRQSVSLSNPNPIGLLEYLKINPKVINKIF